MSATTINLKVNEFVETMSTYITRTTMDEKLRDMKKSSFMLWGAPGIGKSDSLKAIKKYVEETTGKRVNVTDVRLLLFNPVDLRGIPVPDDTKTLAKWLKPQIFQMDPSDDIINILMLDEISAAPPSVQASAYQITLDRKIGEHKLPDNCYVICAGNRLQDKSVAYKMPKALANRLTHFEINADLDDWKVWAINNGIDSRIIGFLNWQPSKLHIFDSSSDDHAFPTPRSWETSNNYLNIYGSLDAAFNCIAGSIGVGTAGEFKRYCKVFNKLPNIQDIFDGKEVEMPTQPDILYALSASISGHIAKESNNERLKNVIEFTIKMPKEFSVLTIKDILLIPGMKQKFIAIPSWMNWVSQHKSLII